MRKMTFWQLGTSRSYPKTGGAQTGRVAKQPYCQYSPANVNNQSQKRKTPTKNRVELLYCKTTNKEKMRYQKLLLLKNAVSKVASIGKSITR